MASSSRRRSSSPFSYRKSPSSHSYSSSNKRLMPRGFEPRSLTPSRSRSDSLFYGDGGYSGLSPVGFALDELVGESADAPQSADSISVSIRFRPLSESEYHSGDEIAWYADGDKIVRNEYIPAAAYAFDKVFGQHTNTQEVYEIAAKQVVKAAMDGVNGTVFTYGVTSSGKTYTMHGDHNSPGIIPLAIKDVFSIIQDTPGREFLLRVSYIEIYNEVINDLLDPTGQNLRVREDAQGTYVEGIKEEVVLSPGHAISFIAAGEEHRHVGSNNFNLFSSRSHTIFTLMIESSAPGDEYDGVIFSQLNLIDLAGSESSKAETTGMRRKEGSYINKSLLTLGTVIGKLSEGKASHVPYRDSKLTRLLQSSLSGNGHVSLICTVTPASSNMEETHNTLKFASRAKRVEIYASRNKIIDEKSLIKKYQREISTLKQELDHLRRGMLVGVNREELVILRQQLERGQVKMQSRLEEEEEAKAALMSRIQRLTKLILVSSKNAIPGCLTDDHNQKISHSTVENRNMDMLHDNSLLVDGEYQKGLNNSVNQSDDQKHNRQTSDWSEDVSHAQVGQPTNGPNLPLGIMSMSDEMELLVEQVKMLAGDIAFSTSTLKRLMEQSVDDPLISKSQIEKLESEIQEKRKQMQMLEQRIAEGGEASIANASLLEMQQTLTRLMAQYDEKGYELEIKSADNHILQEHLQNKFAENEELRQKVHALEKQLTFVGSKKSSVHDETNASEEHVNGLKKKIQAQEIENEKLKLEHVQLSEENSGLCVQNQKLAEEASYAKELASAAAVELKNLAGEVTKLSMLNSKLEKELNAARDFAASRANGLNRKFSDGVRFGRKGHPSVRATGDFDAWNLDSDDLKMELQARKQREEALEAALVEKEYLEDEYRKKVDEAKRREEVLENDLANMWVLVAKLEEGVGVPELNHDERCHDRTNHFTDVCSNYVLEETHMSDLSKNAEGTAKEEPLVVRLKARMQEMKEKEFRSLGNRDGNSHTCKVCFESPTAAILLPCRHFCLCKPCSLACSECPICRTKIEDRLFTFAS
ncbi:hypothetical protein SAY86_013927 [Trapa natans]|uniref:Kinesin-like protein KIN-7D, mitochondrial n=1 Tax=Trapa natans TaxID=22666 RepID=A0AAN7KRU1_TRANT|nr:hypothetical protein SAY86_013927 [Trapa natans]